MVLGSSVRLQGDDDPLWYKDAIIYEVHVRSFLDSNGDGIGDFQGITQKLDYLQDLGVTAIWLLPFYVSPLKDDGYDIADYMRVHPNYGTLRDFRAFLRGAHDRGLRVITELVLNHTSDQHPWFQRARRAAPGSRWRDFYVWNDTPDKYADARVIFKDFESSNWAWDPVAKAYYWHRFYSHQPDLNYDNPQVHRAMFQVVDFWLEMGVDGLRLDAVPYLYEREGTICENLPETHEFLKKLRKHVDRKFPNRMLLAEANQWPEDAAAYFGNGDEAHMAFHFPLMPRLFMAIRMEDRFPIIDILDQTPAIPENSQWAIFLRNHDELTLEMVTDEERDYMYRVYAQDQQARINLGIRRRLAPLLGNDLRRIELMSGLLFSLPGTPIVYYGDEIGMGDNIYLGDRNGVRTPMQWSPDRNAGFSRANPQQLYLPVIIDPQYHYETVNVEEQQNNLHSTLWQTKRLITLRKHYRPFGRGTLEFVDPNNPKVLAFTREYENEYILAVANLSRFSQWAELDLSGYKDMVPVEMFGQSRFPPIGELPYLITLGPHAFYWFALTPPQSEQLSAAPAAPMSALPTIRVGRNWETVFRGTAKARLEQALSTFISSQRWFQETRQAIQSAEVLETIPVPYARTTAYVVLVELTFYEQEPQTYLLALHFAHGESAEQIEREHPGALLARLHLTGKGSGVLHEATISDEFLEALFKVVGRHGRLRGARGKLLGTAFPYLRERWRENRGSPEPSLLTTEQSNTSILYGDQFVLKVFRRIEPGINPDLELGQFLTRKGFSGSAPVAGALTYQRMRGQGSTLGIVHGYVPNQGDAWQLTLEFLREYYERARTQPQKQPSEIPMPEGPFAKAVEAEQPTLVRELISTYLATAAGLGRTTGEMHLALASDTMDPNMAPEPLTAFAQRSLYQSMRTLTAQTLRELREARPELPKDLRPEADDVLKMEQDILTRLRAVYKGRINTQIMRCHGNYNLRELLYTGKAFVIIDFEGEASQPLSERKLKASPLRDVASMLRSFHYAAYAALYSEEAAGTLQAADVRALDMWAQFWYHWVSVAFVRSYLDTCGKASFVPQKAADLDLLLQTYQLQKAIYELAHELAKRPEMVRIALHAILELTAEQ